METDSLMSSLLPSCSIDLDEKRGEEELNESGFPHPARPSGPKRIKSFCSLAQPKDLYRLAI
jgi:hypothetical protein